jgi:peptidylprolyl isomerase
VPTQRDYYSILQINPAASQETIDAAYARLSKVYDPEVSKKRKAADRKQELDEAYEVLSDRKRRAEYDRLRARGWRPGQPEREPSQATGVLAWFGNPYVFAGLVASGVIIILVAIVLISVLGGDDDEAAVANPTATAAPSGAATPTVPGQVQGVAPDSPPEVTGEEITTATGLKYIDVLVGTGDTPLTGDTAVVNYTGWTQADGKKFDSSVERTSPFTFPLGQGGVIAGWDEGVATMKVGGKRRLIVPAELGYGAAGRPPTIPGGATLIFDIELLDVFRVGETAAPTLSPAPAPTATAGTASETATPSP